MPHGFKVRLEETVWSGDMVEMEPFILAFGIIWLLILAYLLLLLRTHSELNKKLM